MPLPGRQVSRVLSTEYLFVTKSSSYGCYIEMYESCCSGGKLVLQNTSPWLLPETLMWLVCNQLMVLFSPGNHVPGCMRKLIYMPFRCRVDRR